MHIRGSSTIGWDEIEDVSADYWGLHIRTRSGQVVTARAFGRPKWRSYGMSRLSTAENLALHLMRLVEGVRSRDLPTDHR